MMSKTRSAFLSLYAALTPALASAKCGNVDYSWGADALASAHDYAVTMMLVPFGISASTGYSVPAPCRRLSVEAVELTIAVCSPLVVGTGVNSMPTALKSRQLAST